MKTRTRLEERLLTWKQVKLFIAKPVNTTISFFLLYLQTAWGAVSSPWSMIENNYQPSRLPAKPARRTVWSGLRVWYRSSRPVRKRLWNKWRQVTPGKTYLTGWVFLGTTVTYFFLVSSLVSVARYLLPHTVKTPDFTEASHRAIPKDSVLVQHSERVFTKQQQQEIAGQDKLIKVADSVLVKAVKSPVIFCILLAVSLLLTWPVARWYSLTLRELYEVGLYGLGLAMLISIPAQLFTEVIAGKVTMLGNILFGLGWVGLPSYYVARYVAHVMPPESQVKCLRLTGALLAYQLLVFGTVTATVLTLGVWLQQQADNIRATH